MSRQQARSNWFPAAAVQLQSPDERPVARSEPQRSSVRLDVAGQGTEEGVSLEDDQNGIKEVETQFVVDSIDGRVNARSDVRSPLTEVSSRRRRPHHGDGVGQGAGEGLVRSPRRGEEETEGRSRMGGCGACGRRCEGFLTDREQRKVWGIGILYVLGFPLLLLMTVVGGLKVRRIIIVSFFCFFLSCRDSLDA